MEQARLARSDDLDAVLEVARRVVEAMTGARGAELFLAREATAGPLGERLTAALGGGRGRIVVGCYDDVVLGFGLATIEDLADGRLLGVIEALAVDPEAREVGIGEAMLDLLLAELTAAGCLGVDARALPGDRETKNFFESFGMKARLLTVHRPLGPADQV